MFVYLEPLFKLVNVCFVAFLIFVMVQDNEKFTSDKLQKEHQSKEILKPKLTESTDKLKEVLITKISFIGEKSLEKHFETFAHTKSAESTFVKSQSNMMPVKMEKHFKTKRNEIKPQNKPFPKVFDVMNKSAELAEYRQLNAILYKPIKQKTNSSQSRVTPLKFQNIQKHLVKKEASLSQIVKPSLAEKPERLNPKLGQEIVAMRPIENVQKSHQIENISKLKPVSLEIIESSKPKEEDIQLAASNLETLVASEGLSITFYWPNTQTEREAVYRSLQHCHGMTLGVFNSNMILFDQKNQRLNKTEISKISPMLRHISAPATDFESLALKQLREKQSGPMVRIFPKRFDAYLIASLRQNSNINKNIKGRITANYSLDDGKIVLKNWNLNGKALSGKIELDVFSSQCG